MDEIVKNRINQLYEKKFEEEEKGNEDKVEEIDRKIKKILKEGKVEKRMDTSDMDVIKESELEKLDEDDRTKYEFFYKTRKKAFHKNLRELLEEYNPDDIDLAMALTSMLTHALIEMKMEGKDIYNKLDINILIETVSDFLSGDLSNNEVLEVIDEYWTEYILTKVEKEEEE